MNFKISKDGISKRRNKPVYSIIFAIIMVLFIILPNIFQKEEIDWVQVIIFTSIVPFVAGASIFGAYKDIQEMRELILEIKDDGIYLYMPQGISILPFEIIKSVNLKYKDNEIKKFILKSNGGKNGERTDNYSDFENLNELNNQLKKYLDKNIWI